METSYAEAVAAEVRVAMARRGLNATSLSTLCDIPRVTLWRRLSGKSAFTVDELAAIARVLEVEISSLMPQDGQVA